jgi:hypothetical protein
MGGAGALARELASAAIYQFGGIIRESFHSAIVVETELAPSLIRCAAFREIAPQKTHAGPPQAFPL